MNASIESSAQLKEWSADHPPVASVGENALLFTPQKGGFDGRLQMRLLDLAQLLESPDAVSGLVEAVPGVNNLLVVFDSLTTSAAEVAARLVSLWDQPGSPNRVPRELVIPVVYGGSAGEDLPALAASAGLPIRKYIERHSEAAYTVACIGAYPGFAFMSGLPSELHAPRRATPRLKLPKGSVIVGGAQAGVMPCTAPSGWHTLGSTSIEMFDLSRESACLLLPGDLVRFRVERIEP